MTKLPSPKELREFFSGEFPKKDFPVDFSDRMGWYFDRFWLDVAAQNGYAYPAAFPEGGDLAAAHNAAHAQLIADIGQLKK